MTHRHTLKGGYMPNTKVSIRRLSSWDDVKEAALDTCGKQWCPKEISSDWKKRILAAEHSPIRELRFKIVFTNLPYWVSVHFVRHNQGIIHFVQSQRDDRNPNRSVSRDDLPQGALVRHAMEVNAAALIQISRKRLCGQASPETRAAWQMVKDELIRMGEVELAAYMIPECEHQHGCPEMKCCGRMPPLPLRSLDDKPAATIAEKITGIWKD